MATDGAERRRRAEVALREAREEKARFEAIVDAIGDGISIQDRELRILYQNARLREMIGDHVGELCHSAYEGKEAPCDGCPVLLSFSDGGIHRAERSGRSGGDVRHVEITASPLRDADGRIVAGIEVVRDVSVRRREEEERQKLVSLIEHTSDLVGMADMDGRILYMNRAGLEMVGLRGPEEARGTRILDYIAEEDRERFRRTVLDPVLERGSWTGTFRLRHFRTGGWVPVELNGFLIREAATGRPLAVAAVCRDVTERRRMEEEVLRARKLDSLGVLAGGIAHDFNNLLSAIAGNVSLARVLLAPGSMAGRRLGEAEKACLRAQDLTRQLLTFSRGGAPVKRAATVGELVRESAAFALRGTKVRAEFAVPDDLWAAEVDEGQISQVLQNLVINAEQAMPRGGVVRVEAENAVVPAGDPLPLEPGDYVRIRVIDRGVGIPPEHLGQIFDPYFTTKPKGSGLGLATVYSIVRKHDGHVDVASRPGEGTVFTVHIPALRDRVAPPADKGGVTAGAGRVLVMDDEEMVRDVMGAMLSALGYEAGFAADGERMVALYGEAAAAGRPYDVVVLDLTVPGGTGGVEALGILRARFPDARAVVSSGYSNDPVMARHGEFGFLGVLPKPVTIQELGRTLHQVLRGS